MKRKIKNAGGQVNPSLLALAVSQALMCVPVVQLQAATINVDPPGMANSCTLREAINAANNDSQPSDCEEGDGPDTINLPANTTFSFTSGLSGSINGDSALPTITSNITINGNGSTIKRDDAAVGKFRLIEVVGGNLSLNNVTLSDAEDYYNGAGLLASNASSVSLLNSTVSGNYTGASGGGIAAESSSTITLSNSLVTDNACYTGGCGVSAEYSVININESTISGNDCVGGNFGGGISVMSSNLNVSESFISGNYCPYVGAIILRESNASIIETVISGNSGGAYIGGISVENGSSVSFNGSTIFSNSANETGGIRVKDSTVTFIKGSILDNYSYYGAGGLELSTGSVDLQESTISGNTTSDVGGGVFIESGNFSLFNSTISGNSSGAEGGGIYAGAGNLDVINSTISSNEAKEKGGGLYIKSGVTATLLNSTLFNNAVVPDGIFVPVDSGGGLFTEAGATALTLSNIVIAKSVPRDCGGEMPRTGVNNWFEDTSCDGVLPAQGAPLLGELQNNGGPTRTHAPLPGSGLEGAGSGFVCQVAPVNNKDQRGQTRNAPCFIGAVDDIIDPTVFFTIPLPNGKVVVISL